MVKLCYEMACLPASISTEREYARHMESLEVLHNRKVLDTLHTKLLCSFCLGMLHVKFQPYWNPAINVMAAVAKEGEGTEVFWPLLLDFMQSVGSQGSMSKTSKTQKKGKSDKSGIGKALTTAGVDADTSEEGLESEFPQSNSNSADVRSMALALSEMGSRSDGTSAYSDSTVQSHMFYYRSTQSAVVRGAVNVAVDSRTDPETVYLSAWKILKKIPEMMLKKSKVTVPLFLRFLTEQYYVTMTADSEIPYLKGIGLFDTARSEASSAWMKERAESQRKQSSSSSTSTSTSTSTVLASVLPTLNYKTAKMRLSMFLEVFSRVTSPKGLYVTYNLTCLC